MQAGGEVAYRVKVNGHPAGWVGDGRPWRGHRLGSRKWWACWREEGDTAARWDSGLDYGTRAAALARCWRRCRGEPGGAGCGACWSRPGCASWRWPC